jgi:structure-specific endonuclease subunit SLX1
MQDTENIHEIEKFYGCYLLCSTNERYKGRTYIGFTVNPTRRLKQHNSGYAKGGAKRTSGKGPWDMVLIIHGFPNEISALRFEWAWQNPEKSLRLKHLVPKTKHYSFTFKFSIVCEMLRTGPWCRLPLTVRWLRQEYMKEFPFNKQPPAHMPIVFGPVKVIDKPKKKTESVTSEVTTNSQEFCFICKNEFNDDYLKCIRCNIKSHIICLANYFLADSPDCLIPIEGNCPQCKQLLLWGDLIRFRLGCYKHLDLNDVEDINENNDSINSDSE